MAPPFRRSPALPNRDILQWKILAPGITTWRPAISVESSGIKLFLASNVPGDLTMRKHTLLILSLLAGFLVLSRADVKAQQTSSTARAKRWSDPATWPDKKVPGKDALVTIGRDMNVVLDVTPPELHGLTINGKLSFADNKDLELTTEWVMVHGELEIGTAAKPHTRKATITLTDNVKDEDISGIGGTNDRSDRGIMLMGGTLNLHGNRTNSWTKLSKTAEAGSNSIQVLN